MKTKNYIRTNGKRFLSEKLVLALAQRVTAHFNENDVLDWENITSDLDAIMRSEFSAYYHLWGSSEQDDNEEANHEKMKLFIAHELGKGLEYELHLELLKRENKTKKEVLQMKELEKEIASVIEKDFWGNEEKRREVLARWKGREY